MKTLTHVVVLVDECDGREVIDSIWSETMAAGERFFASQVKKGAYPEGAILEVA